MSSEPEVKSTDTSKQSPVELDLAYAFGGDIIDQNDAILAWIELILVNTTEMQTSESLCLQLAKGNTLYPPIDVEIVEVENALRRGKRQGSVEEHRNKWCLTEKQRFALRGAEDEAREIEERVKNAWLSELTERYKDTLGISFESLSDEIWPLLEHFLVSALRSYTHYLSELTNGTKINLPKELEDTLLAQLEENNPLREKLRIELPGFLLAGDQDRRRFIGRVFAGALYAYRTSVSNISSEKLSQVIKDQFIYLDT